MIRRRGEFWSCKPTDTCFVQENSKRKLGRPSKGPRHPFTVKLDPERSAKLKEILGTLDVAGTDYLGSIIEAHVDGVDVHELVSQWPEGELAAANSGAPVSRVGIRRKLAQEEVLRRAQALSWKINLLLDARVDPSGQRYKFSVICAGVQKFGIHLSRTRWSRLKEGQAQVVSDDCLRAIANVFGVDSEYLLHENAELPPEVKEVLPQLRLQRLSEVRAHAVKALGLVDPDLLQEMTTVLDQAIQEEPVRYGDRERSFRWVATSRTDCSADIRRRAFSGDRRR